MAIPMLADFGFEKGELGVVLSMNAIAYGFSKFIMASISDRSNARAFLPLGLTMAAISMLFMIVPIQWIGAEHKSLAIVLMAALNFLVGWFNGMGWPPCGRVMTHWFSIKERGTWMSFWNCAHNVGGALVGPMAVYGALWFGSWFYGADEKRYFLIGTYAFPAAVAVLIAIVAYLMIHLSKNGVALPRKIIMKRPKKCCRPKKYSRWYWATNSYGISPLPTPLSTWFAMDVWTGHPRY